MALTQMTPEEFWNAYFSNHFLRLRRENDFYTGEMYANPDQTGSPLVLLKDFPRKSIEIPMALLRKYDYAADPRFALILKTPVDISVALEKIIATTYPYREPAPFGKQRMSELFTLIGERYGLDPQTELTLSNLEQILQRLVDNYSIDLIQPIAALAWFLGEQRHLSSAEVLIAIIRNSNYSPFAKHLIHFTAVNAAFTALWKINPKSKLLNLVELMQGSSESGKRKFASLFERLLSTKELLSIGYLGENYINPDFWRKPLETNFGNYTPLDWDRFDTKALFWEIRFLAAVRLPPTETEALERLVGDEVSTVVAEVHRKLGPPRMQ